MAERYYSVDDADAALEGLRTSLARIRQARTTLIRSAERIRQVAPSNGGGTDAAGHWESLRILREEVEGLAARGIILRDAERGLIDFPSRREGRLVYLCWQLDEDDRVGFWHEAGAGFGNRKPLDR